MKLHIAQNLSLPEDTVTQTLVIYGGKGMGKTNLASVLAEELSAAGRRFAVIDPMGVWWGLRHDKSGKGRGVELLILGGRHGDMPIEPTGGAIVADMVVDEDVDVLIDISSSEDGRTWSRGARIRFVRDYCQRLYERQGEQRRPIMQIIDEAARFVPQTIRSGDKDVVECAGAIETIVEEGRNFGIGITLIAQRSARLNKSVAELAECMIAFRTIGPNSVGAIMDWLGDHVRKERWNDLLEKLRELPRGEALVVSPGWLHFEDVAKIRARRTFDSSATPKVGGHVKVSGKGARPVDLERYKTAIAATVEKADSENPSKLRARLKALETALEAAKSNAGQKAGKTESTKGGKPDAELLKKEFERGVNSAKREVAKTLRDYARGVENLFPAVAKKVTQALQTSLLDGWAEGLPKLPDLQEVIDLAKFTAAVPESRPRPFPAPPVRTPAPAPPARSAVRSSTSADVGGGALRMLHVLAQRAPAKFTRAQWGTLAGLAHTGGTFGTYLSRLKTGGLIETDGRLFWASNEGINAAGDLPPAPSSPAEVLDTWKRALGGGSAKMLDYLAAHPDGVTRDQLAEACNLTANAGTFGTYLSRLSANALIEKNGSVMRLSEVLFVRS